jgi:23S rRNA (cytidine1920-2'-O)/16S rRNA (cytidine1409-2'-O)-methyltransferase
MTKERIDILLVKKQLVQSRARAGALVMSGAVLVNDAPVTKAGTKIDEDADIRIKGRDNPFVSRGGIKLEGALVSLNIDVTGRIILDVGASTGGFTDCVLKRGAKRVFAVDVGTNQLAYSLRSLPEVFCLEQTNARTIKPDMFPSLADMAVMDLSFISLTKVLKATSDCLQPDGEILAMVKPQFEVGREKVGKGGVVRDKKYREEAVQLVVEFAEKTGLVYKGRAESSIKGPKGNQEIFVYFSKM